jgi:large subunit ribosomal protein L10
MVKKSEKMKFVQESKKELGKYKVIGVANLNGIPDRLLQASRNKMKKDVKLILGRKNLLEKVLEGEKTKSLVEQMNGTSAIIMSNADPFEIYKEFHAHELKLAAKPKQLAPEDIMIQSGETSLQPGQAVTELKQAGVDVQIQKGKVVIAKDKVIVKKGEVISITVSKVLHTLGTLPFRAVIEPAALLSDGILFTKDILAINEETTRSDLLLAFANAYTLSLERGIINEYTIRPLIVRAFTEAKVLGIEAKVYEPGIIESLLGSAAAQASALNSMTETSSESQAST